MPAGSPDTTGNAVEDVRKPTGAGTGSQRKFSSPAVAKKATTLAKAPSLAAGVLRPECMVLLQPLDGARMFAGHAYVCHTCPSGRLSPGQALKASLRMLDACPAFLFGDATAWQACCRAQQAVEGWNGTLAAVSKLASQCWMRQTVTSVGQPQHGSAQQSSQTGIGPVHCLPRLSVDHRPHRDGRMSITFCPVSVSALLQCELWAPHIGAYRTNHG